MPTIRERNGRYQAQVRIKRQGQIVFQESETFDTERQALLWGMSLEKKLERTGYAEHTLESTTVSKIVELHQAMLVSIGKETRGYEPGFQHISSSKLGAKSVSSVRSADITQWAIQYAEGRSAATVLHTLMCLRAAFRSARTMNKIPTEVPVVADAINELMRLGIAARSTERERRVTDAEIDIICKRHELKFTSIPLRKICTLAVALPRRREELLTMKWEDYKNEEITLWDTKDPVKVRNEVIPVPPSAQSILATLPRTDARILPYNPQTISSTFCRTAALAGLDDVTFHDLRHEGISRLFEAGLNIPEVSLISGHRSWATLKRYTQLKPQHVLEKLNAGSKRAQEAPAKSK
jgi:integrase